MTNNGIEGMERERLNEEYFQWLCRLVCDDESCPDWEQTLRTLNTIDYYYVLAMDRNREGDGLALRNRFAADRGYTPQGVRIIFKSKPCSVLEMMAALALRWEETIMCDPAYGNRTSRWFFTMMDSLGLSGMYADGFDEKYIYDVIDRWLVGDYEATGRGGLFTVHDGKGDMRKEEIWYQLMRYLHENER